MKGNIAPKPIIGNLMEKSMENNMEAETKVWPLFDSL